MMIRKAIRAGLCLLILAAALAGCGTDTFPDGLPEGTSLQGAYHPDEWITGRVLHAQGFVENHLYCLSCHGDQLRPKLGTVACGECHAGGKPDCISCHSTIGIAISGRHVEHVYAGDDHPAYDCSSCHDNRPNAVDSESPAGNGEVTFPGLGSGAVWDPATMTCTNTCHAGTRSWVGGSGDDGGSENGDD